MKNLLPSVKTLCKIASAHSQLRICSRRASTSPNLTSSPVYELRMYSLNPKDFKAATELYDKSYQLRLKYSKLFGFWTSEIGDNVSQFVHIWEYDSLSHRRQIRTTMAGDEVWTTQFLPSLLPNIGQWKNSLLITIPGSKHNMDFTNDPSAVYLLDQVKVNDYNQSPAVPESKSGELLVSRFCGVLGPSKTEYRLWRYSHVDGATEGATRRAIDAPFDGSTMLLYPTKFSPIQ